ncbi:MAG: hypothetical protein K0R97_390 [Oerskovia sp.]|jgi:hypothetical protein|nr:hypothetical protein [Oerskovia sp.]
MTQATPDDGLIELTSHELLVLLSLNDGPAASATRRELRLQELPEGSPVMAAGVSTLLVRGLATVDGELLQPTGNVLPLTRILTTAEQWVEAATISGGRSNAALLVGALMGAVVIEPRPFGVWHVRPLRLGTDLVQSAATLVRTAFEAADGARPFGGTIKTVDATAATTSNVRIGEDGVWELAAGPVGSALAPAAVGPDPTFAVLVDGVRATRA